MPEQSIYLSQGTLDLLTLRSLVLGPTHGWVISERIHQVSSKVLQVNQGSLYPALHRPGAPWLDQGALGHTRKQPPCEILRTH